MSDIEKIKGRLKQLLDPQRFAHSIRVQEIAIDLAGHYGIDPEKASLSGLLHDCARSMSLDQLKVKAKELRIKSDPVFEIQPKLFHADLSAWMAENEFGVKDKDALQAIAHHTIGEKDMSVLDKIIYLADHIEPEREYDGVDDVRKLAYENIDAAVALSMESMIRRLQEKGEKVYYKTVEVKEYYKKRGGR